MRKTQKKEILEFINSLYMAHEEISEAASKNDRLSVGKMLMECQEFAIELGQNIESIEGKEHITVSLIEEYCELLFCIYSELEVKFPCHGNFVDGEQINVVRICKFLKKQLIKIENSVKNDINVRREIAFFPYKASMWDSLESIYLAAEEDETCDVYCVPIPYYDLNADGSIGQMHYEGMEYPQNIEITDWQTYNFEARKPDEIYIHNPYDNWNRVTSVHPRFYSDNLKKYTEKLIYVPYFILDEIEPDAHKTIEAMKHFCFVPGIINADKVIVQSEKMKQIYVNEYLKAAKEYGFTGRHIDRKYLEQKILGLGSPKIDKVANTRKESLDIPKEWLSKILKPDGSWKKIIFYNTGIVALLRYDMEWIKKIEDVFKAFRKEKDSVTLLWRPHPLIENTMRSMRMEVFQRYMELKDKYIREEWGIYDDTADVDRAIVLSDAYYGDLSSVAELYRRTKKMVMIQNVRVRCQ